MPIKLDKAIELLDNWQKGQTPGRRPDEFTALRLGLAALEAIRFCRKGGTWHPEALLPGEQPEEIVKGG